MILMNQVLTILGSQNQFPQALKLKYIAQRKEMRV